MTVADHDLWRGFHVPIVVDWVYSRLFKPEQDMPWKEGAIPGKEKKKQDDGGRAEPKNEKQTDDI